MRAGLLSQKARGPKSGLEIRAAGLLQIGRSLIGFTEIPDPEIRRPGRQSSQSPNRAAVKVSANAEVYPQISKGNEPRQSNQAERDFSAEQSSHDKRDQKPADGGAREQGHSVSAVAHDQSREDKSSRDGRPGRDQKRRGRKGRRRGGAGEGLQSQRPPQSRQDRPEQERGERSERSGEPRRQQGGDHRGNRGSQPRGARQGQPAGNRNQQRSDRTVYAALDLGTNNCRLLVAEPHGSSFRVVDSFSRIVRLGEGLSQTGRLSNEAQERAIAALKICKSKLSYRRVKRFRLIATEACRRAFNGGAFLHRVYKETGLKLEIVNRETEARLAVAGCASLVHPEAEGVVLFDIGGGSSEIVWLDLDKIAEEDKQPLPGEKRNRQTRRAMRRLSERMRCWTSLQVGVVTLSEKHGGHIVTKEHFEAMVSEVREMLHEFEEREALARAIQNKHIHMLGTSGTVTTLAGVHLGLERYDRKQVDGTWLSAHEVRSMISRVLEMDFEERIANPCIGQDRADLVLAGCAILEAFHREWPCPRLRVADRGLREGILMEMMLDDGVWTPQSSKKRSGKSRRPRRRGGRGHRGQSNQAQTSQGQSGSSDQD